MVGFDLSYYDRKLILPQLSSKPQGLAWVADLSVI
jgi:hypothetical protein